MQMAQRDQIINFLYNSYKANGFITEDEALSVFIAHGISLSEIDSLTEHLLAKGTIIKTGGSDEEEDFTDRSKLNYDEIFDEVLSIEPGLTSFIDYVRDITPPQNREWQSLLPQAKNGNVYAQNRIVEMYLRTVIKEALYYTKKYQAALEDTLQDGAIGLIIAIKKYDSTKHEKFATYAPWWIRQSITRGMSFTPFPLLYFPAHYQEKLYLIYGIVKNHSCQLCHSDSTTCPALVTRVSKKLSCTSTEANEYIQYFSCNESLDNIMEFNEQLLSDQEKFGINMFERITNDLLHKQITILFEELTERESQVLNHRFGLDGSEAITLEETGAIFGVTRERIRQIEAKAIRKLQHPTRSKLIFDYYEKDSSYTIKKQKSDKDDKTSSI